MSVVEVQDAAYHRGRRKHARVSREELAEALGTSAAMIFRLEAGKKTDAPEGFNSLREFWQAHEAAVMRIAASRLTPPSPVAA